MITFICKRILMLVSLFGFFVQTIARPSFSVYFSNLTIEQGLPSNVTNSIAQDKYGFIWIGTQEGLCRYDGFETTVFQNSEFGSSIPSNNISSLVYDNDLMWVGTWHGLCTIDIHTYEIRQINTGRSKTIRALYKDSSGNIWIGTAEGLLKHDTKRNTYKFFDTSNSGLSHNTIRSFHEDQNGDLWIGTYDGLNRYHNDTISSFNVKGDYKPFLENNLVVSISYYAGNCDSLLWVGTETGLVRFNTKTGSFKQYNSSNTGFSNEVIKTIYHQADSLLWLGTDFGLNIFNTKTREVSAFYHDPLVGSTIANNVVWEIFEDLQKRLWLITSGGVSVVDKGEPYYMMHEEFFSFSGPRIGNQIRDILTDRQGNIWLATIHGVVKKYPGSEKRKTFSTNSASEKKLLLDNVYALEEDHEGRIWIGTAGGINIWDPGKQRMYSITAGRDNGLTSNYISGIVQDTDGTIWVSAWEGGVFKTDSVVKSPKTVKFRLIEKNGDGRLLSNGKSLFYAIGNTLWRFNGSNDGKQPVEEVNQYTANKTITALLSSDKGNCIWIGADEQLLKYTPESRKVKKIEVNITSPKKIINLEQDKYGNIWGTTQNSVFRIDAWNDEMITIPVSHSSPFKGFYPYCSASVEHGKILFGGDNAYIEINPSTVTVPEMNPQIYITALRIDNQIMQPVGSSGILSSDIAFMDKLDLKYYQNSLTFEFSTLDYLFPDKGQFRYRLKPVQEKWIYNPGNNNFAVFANVKPGEYTLEVQGTNNLGVWSHKRELYIDIAPSIWLSNTFLALYVVLFLAMTYFIFRVYNYRQRLKNELQIVRLEKQHSEALYQAKIRFFTNISHEFRTPLGLIISPLKQLAGSDIRDAKLHKIIELAQRNAQRLYKLINQLLDFRKIESSQLHLVTEDVEMVSFTREVFESFDNLARRQKINYHFDTGVGQLNCHIDREKVETIIFNLLSNAFKYTPESGGIGVKLDVSDAFERQSAIVLSVEDSGPGIPKEDSEHIFELFYQTDESKNTKTGSGIGLTLAMEYAQLHGGTINLESRPGKGSRFTLLLPLVETSIFEEEIYVEEEKSSEGITAVSAPEKAPEDAKRILIVDDNQDFRDYLEMNLESDFRLLFAENGFKGLKLARKEMPDLIISDIMMPVMDGADLCGNIKTDVATAHIPIILLTAKTLDIDKTEGMSKGADMYITKPFDLEFLRSSMQSIFRREEQMTRYIESRLLLSPPAREDKQHPDELFLKKVMSVIERNVGNPGFSVEMISETMGMSSTHLYRKLKAITGFSTSEIINSYRMQKAAQMLTNKEGNITEVMYAVGFSSLSSFSKSFKAKYGVAPTKYKSTV